MPKIAPDWVTSSELCQELGVTEGTLRYWRKKLNLQVEKVGTSFLYSRWEVENKLKPEFEKRQKKGRR